MDSRQGGGRRASRALYGILGAASGLALLAAMVPALRPLTVRAADPCGPPVVNPVACENTRPGNPSSEWDISGFGDGSIQGFATDISVNKGETVSFKIDTSAPSYTITVYRMGYYQGNGARRIATVTPVPRTQPACRTDPAVGLVDCGNWSVSASWAVPADAVSGIYFARLFRSDTGGASHIMFVVRDDSSSSGLLFQTSDTTWQAYNQWGGNSLYLGSAPSSDGRAYKVSYNRPFATRGQSGGYGPANFVFYAEYPMVRWLESNGYDVSYFTGVDTDRRGGLIQNHRVFLSVGHDEYWSAGMRASAEAARAAGVNLAFFSGNEVFWKVRWETSIDGSGTAYRTLVCYKETKSPTPIDPADPPTWTGTWRDPSWSPPADGGRPENALMGTIFTVNRGSAAIQVPYAYSRMRLWRNTSVAGLAPGQTATLGFQTLGYEWDEDLDNGSRPPGLVDLSSTTVDVPERIQDYGNTYGPGTATHKLTLYRHPGGGLVFGAGTVQWVWGLDIHHDTSPDTGPTSPDVRMQQATANLLADMGALPTTLQAGLVSPAAPADTVAPTSTITSPASGSSFAPGTNVTITGTASDGGGGVLAAVEVSVDGGASWHSATGTTSWSYTWTVGRQGPVTILNRAVDDSANLEVPGPGVTVGVIGSGQPSFLSVATVTNGTTVARPAGVLAGDLLLASMEVDADPVTVNGPAGWTRLLDTRTAPGFHSQVWYKVATASEPASYSWAVSGGVYVDIALMAYINISSTSPIDVSAGRDAGDTATPTTPSVTTTVPGALLVALFINYHYGTWTPGSGMTERYDFDSCQAQDAIQAAAGATGTKTATNTTSGPIAAQILALRPAQSDNQAPTVSMTAPAAGATVSGSAVTVAASASDNVGVSWVQFKLDGADLGPRVTSPPYSMSWDSTSTSNGAHSLGAQAGDAAGNVGSASPVGVTVDNATPAPPVISNVAAGGITASGATITWTTSTPSDSTVEYGTTTAYGSSTSSPSLVTSHSVGLSGLAAATTYHYRVKSRDAYSQLSTSGDFTFTTAAAPPQVPSFRSQSTVTNGFTVTKPSGVAAGDLLLASMEIDANPVTVTPPAGWTLLLDTLTAQGTPQVFHAQVWYKLAGASEPSSYTWNVSGSPYTDIALLAYRDVNTASPIDVSAGRDAGVTAQPTTPAITTNFANDMLVAFFINFYYGTYTPGSGMTERYDFDSCQAEDVLAPAAGAVSAKTATNTTSGATSAQIVAIRGP